VISNDNRAEQAYMPGVLSNGKHIAVNISVPTAILVWKPQEITKTLLNPTIVHHDSIFRGRIANCCRNVLVVRNESVVDV
jgi:hypothetical protein